MTTTQQAPDTEQTPPPAAEEAPAPVKARRELAATTAGSWFARGVLILSGLLLVVGFFLPWLKLGGLASISGFGLMVADGDAIDMVSGPPRLLLFAVPLLGAMLVVGGITGHRVTAWLALACGLAVIGYGAITLLMLFFSTTGSGMWMVIFGAFAALATGLLLVGLGRRRH